MTDTSHQMHQDRETLPERVELARRSDPGKTIILVYLPWNTCTPFVTWQEGQAGAPTTFWGHYHRTLSAALEDYETR